MTDPQTDVFKPTERNSNLELLRIIAMFVIVFHHAFFWGGMELEGAPELNVFIYGIGMYCGQIGVLIFFLITGYFMVRQKFTARKLIRMLLEIYFYSWSILIIYTLCAGELPGNFLCCVFPIVGGEWWFVTVYLALMLISPILNMVLNVVGQKKHLIICALMLFMTYVVYLVELYPKYVASFGVAITMYVLAAYIRLHPSEKILNPKFGRMLASGTITVNICILLGLILWSKNLQLYDLLVQILAEKTSITELLIALGLFLTFLTLEPRHDKRINWVASSTFGIYLIHQSIPVKHWLWSDYLDMGGNFMSSDFPIYALVCAVIVFLTCLAIDKMRLALIFKPLEPKIDLLCERLETRFRKEGFI